MRCLVKFVTAVCCLSSLTLKQLKSICEIMSRDCNSRKDSIPRISTEKGWKSVLLRNVNRINPHEPATAQTVDPRTLHVSASINFSLELQILIY